MAGRVAGKVAFITGAARSQGRSHAIRLAEEGADIIAVDIAAPVESVTAYPGATEKDLAETVRQVEALDRRIVAHKADVRNPQALKAAVDDGVAQLGKLDIAIANAGIYQTHPALELDDAGWQETIDINLTGVWNTVKVALPHLVANKGGSVILTSSVAGLKGLANSVHYNAAKHGVVGLAKGFARLLGPHGVRVNVVHPTAVDTYMINNPHSPMTQASDAQALARVLPVDRLQPVDVSRAILWLVSDAAFAVTGQALALDAGVSL